MTSSANESVMAANITESKASVLDATVVQRSFLASDPPKDNSHLYKPPSTRERRDVIIALRLTRSLLERIECYQAKYRKRARTDAIIDLLEIAIYIMDNVQRLGDPEVVKYFRENMYNVQIVDDIMDWPQDRIEAIIGVLGSERDRRLRLRLGRHFQTG